MHVFKACTRSERTKKKRWLEQWMIIDCATCSDGSEGSLYKAMRAGRIGKAELARRLNCHLPQIGRLLDLRHASRVEQIEQAFLALGKRLTISLEDAA